MRVSPYYLVFLMPLSVVVGHRLGGIYTFLTPLLTFGLIPLLDIMVGTDRANPAPEEMEALAKKLRFRLVTYLYVPVQVALVVWGAYVVAHQNPNPIEFIGLVLSIGITTGGIGITVAHELCHKRSVLEKTLGKILLMTVSYMHFYIEHLLGHHLNVGTPRDPATARLGESFYAFYPRTVIGSFRSAWQIEIKSLQKAGYSKWSHHNQMLWFIILPILLAASLGWAFGWKAIPCFFAQCFVAFSLLEVVNYLEHYGLERKEISPGRYERVSAAHAWNASNRITNYFLFKLQRHADHHIHPVRRYQTLRHFDESPQLPTGYAGMVLLALIPILWRKVMDPKVHEFRQKLTATYHSY